MFQNFAWSSRLSRFPRRLGRHLCPPPSTHLHDRDQDIGICRTRLETKDTRSLLVSWCRPSNNSRDQHPSVRRPSALGPRPLFFGSMTCSVPTRGGGVRRSDPPNFVLWCFSPPYLHAATSMLHASRSFRGKCAVARCFSAGASSNQVWSAVYVYNARWPAAVKKNGLDVRFNLLLGSPKTFARCWASPLSEGLRFVGRHSHGNVCRLS